jgi:dTDP-4-dehydrorhamnose reductase
MVVLITGGVGALGVELQKVFPKNISPTHEELDITKKRTSKENISAK